MIISINSHKGGVGKSTLALALPYYLRKYFQKILLIDFDPQANVTRRILGHITENKSLKNIFDFLIENDVRQEESKNKLEDLFKSINTFIFVNNDFSVNILGSELSLSKSVKKMNAQSNIMVFRIIDFVRYISKQFDLVIIDTPPSIDLLTFSAIAASDYHIIPITADIDAVHGAFDIIKDIVPDVMHYYNPNIDLLGVILNMSEARTRVDKKSFNYIKNAFGYDLLPTAISRATKIRELNFSFTTIIENLKNTKIDKEFSAIAEELIKRINIKENVNG